MHEEDYDWEDRLSRARGGSTIWPLLRNAGFMLVALVILIVGMPRMFNAIAPEPQVTGEIAQPGDQPEEDVDGIEGGYEIVVPATSGGHFLVEAEIDGVAIEFLVDTGSSMVVLSEDDAELLGLRADELDFTERYQTANGIIEGAPVVLDRMRIGDLELEDVRSTVIRAPLDRSLLGMTFLSRLEGYEVERDRLILRW